MPTILDRIIPLYRKRVLQRAKENEDALRAFGAYSPAEFNDLKDRMLKAYKTIGTTSAPVVNTRLTGLGKFLRSGEYRNLGSTGVTIGENMPASRLRYSNSTYGYDQLPGAEKYGTVPMDELSEVNNEGRLQRGSVSGDEYGEFRIHFKPNLKRYATINAFDSINQWPDNPREMVHANLYPIPYLPDDPEAYIGAFMDAPVGRMVDEFREMGWTPSAMRNEMRVRNDEVARLMEGRNKYEYIESHLHGPVTRDDIDFIEVLDHKHDAKLPDIADRYNIMFRPYAEYRSPRPLDARRELEPRPAPVEDWMRRLRR